MTRAADLAKLIAGGGSITVDDNSTNITLKSTDADANVGPLLDLNRDSGSPADSDFLGKIQFSGDDDGGNKLNYAFIDSQILDASNGSEDGQLNFYTAVGGSSVSRMQLGSETVFNQDSVDVDFRVETNAESNAFLVDAGNENINFFTSSAISTGSNSGTGVTIQNNGRLLIQADDGVDSSAVPLRIGRLSHDDGDTIVLFSTNGDARGSVSVSGGTVSFNAFMGSHITQAVPSDTLEGTVLESTGELIDSEEEDYEGYVQQKRLTKCKVSDTEDSNNVYGIFQTESKSGLQYASALGSFFVRVHKDETVRLGDLLSSKGDGTAKVQSDDIIRSRTIGKVTSLIKKTTHSDGSYLLPCVLYCG
jgi:hypothetical protein